MDSYNETKFLNDFMNIYEDANEYDFTILFDDYFAEFMNINSQDFLKTVYEYYNIEKAKTLLNKTTPKNEWGMIWGK